MDYKEGLKKWDKLVYDCGHCRICTLADYHKLGEALPICPSGEYFGFESFFSPGKVELIRGLIEGTVKPSETAMKVAFACPECGACGAMCSPLTYFGFTVKDNTILFEDLREPS
jgi:hypothetical protein